MIHRGCDYAASAQALDFFGVEPEFLENFVVMFAKIGRALCRYFRDAVHLNRTADRELYVFSGAFQRNDDVVGLQLRIFNDVVRIAHQTVSDEILSGVTTSTNQTSSELL